MTTESTTPATTPATTASRSAPEARPPERINALLAAAAIGASLALLFAVPFAVRADPAWGLLAIPLVLTTNTTWSLIHEAIHGLAFADRRINDAVGRLLGIAFGAPFRALRTGHLLHHRFSRTPRERAEVFDGRRTSRLAAALGYYPRLLGGMYALEAVGAVASLLPARAIAAIERRLEGDDTVAHLVVRALRQGRALTEVRIDTAIVLALLAGAIVLYGAHWWMLAAALAGRAFLVSFADNSYHYATKLDAPREAKNVRAPRWLELALLNFPLHGVHHVHPALPWRALRARFEADGGRYDEGYFACLARQLRGPIEVGELEGR